MRRNVVGLTAAIASRLAHLVLIFAFSQQPESAASAAVLVLAAASSWQSILDPGLATLAASDRQIALSRSGIFRSSLLQVPFSLLSVVLSLLLIGGASATFVSSSLFVPLIGALALMSIESVIRVMRTVGLHTHDNLLYAWPDLAGAAARAIFVVLLYAHCYAAAGVSAAISGLAMCVHLVWWTLRSTHGYLESGVVGLRSLLSSALPIGLSTTIAGGYSQLQIPIVALLADVHSAAEYSLAMRIIQASEILPLSLAQMAMPSISDEIRGSAERKALVRRLTTLGVLCSIVLSVLVLLRPVAVPGHFYLYVTLLLPALIFKYGNYGRAYSLIADRKVGQRIRASMLVAAVGVPTLFIAGYLGIEYVCVSSVLLELLLAIAMSRGLESREGLSKMARVVVMNAHYVSPGRRVGNNGDASLLDVSRVWIEEHLGITVSKVDGSQWLLSQNHKFPRVLSRCPTLTRLISMCREFRRATCVVVAGGTLLADDQPRKLLRGHPAALVQIAVLSRLLACRLVIVGVGVEPVSSLLKRKILSYALRRCAYVAVRDSRSLAMFREFYPKVQVALGADLFWLDREGVQSLGEDEARNNQLVYALTAADLARARSFLREESVVLAMEESDVSSLDNSWGASIRRPQSWREAYLVVAGARVVVASRMHALYFAARASVPCVAVCTSAKVSSFASEFGIPSVATCAEIDDESLGVARAAEKGTVDDAIFRAEASMREAAMRVGLGR